MSRSEFKGRRLRTDCLAVTPLSQSAVEAIYGMEGTLPKHAVDNLCKSHGRRPENRGKHPCRTCGVGHFRNSVCDRCGTSQAADDAKYRQWLKSRETRSE